MDISNRKLAAIVFSDVVDFTVTMAKNEKLGLKHIKDHSSLIQNNIKKYNGEVLKELGDGCLMIFDSAYNAVKFSKLLQEIITAQCDFKVRVGIHVGDVIKEKDDYFGSGVNIASRIYGFAKPGQICITKDVNNHTRGHEDIDTKSLGEKEIKGIDDTYEIFQLINHKSSSQEKTEEIKKEKKVELTFFSELLARRIPQFIGFYVAVGWTVIQFIDWFTIRYQYSPHLVDLGLAVIISMIPSVLILSYFHGAPGKDRWTKVEKIGIPLNLIATIIALTIFFYPKDLGATTKTVSYEHVCAASCTSNCKDYGKVMDRIVPKSEFRKSITLYNLGIDAENTEKSWLSYGLPGAISWKLHQDLYINSYEQFQYNWRLKKYNKTVFDNLSVSLQREISLLAKDEYFLNGKIKQENNKYNILVNIYHTKSFKKISSKTFISDDIFELIDDLSLFIRKDIGVPINYIEESIDLPANELLTKSEEALRMASEGAIRAMEEHEKAIDYFLKAVKIDDSFVIAYLGLHNIYQADGQGDNQLHVIEKIIDNIYKLPEKLRFIPNVLYYFETKQPDKAFKVALMQAELFPDDVLAYNVLGEFYAMKSQHDKEIEQYKKVLKLFGNKYGTDVVSNYIMKIGNTYFYDLGDYDKALKYYLDHLEGYPDDYEIYTTLGTLYETMNDYEKAEEMYNQALLYDTNNVEAMLDLAYIKKDLGIGRIEEFTKILDRCNTIYDTLSTYRQLYILNEEYGKIKEGIKYINLALSLTEDKMPLNFYGSFYITLSRNYAQIDQFDQSVDILNYADEKFKLATDEIRSPMWKISMYIEAEKWSLIEEQIQIAKNGHDALAMDYWKIHRHEGIVSEYVYNDYQKAISLYEEYLDNNKAHHYAGIHISIARCYRLLGEYKKSKNKLDEIYGTSLKYLFDADYEYALLYRDMGEYSKALEKIDIYLDHYKFADPDHIEVNRAKALKEQLLKFS